MGLTLNRTVTVKDKAGHEIVLDEKDEVKTETQVVVTCDGPSCSFGEHGQPSTYTWSEEDAKDNPEAIPDDAYRLLVLQLFSGKKFLFCSRACLRDFMRTYIALRSPRELTEEMTNNLSVATGKKPEDIQLKTDDEVNEKLKQYIDSANKR